MLDKADLVRLHEYTVWANHRVLRVAATLGVEEYRREMGTSHGSVRGTLAHVLGAEWLWLERWKGLSPERLPDEAEFPTIVELRDRWTAVEAHRASWLASLRDDAPASTVRWTSTEGRPFEAALWTLVQHQANHSTYHRGQAMALLRLLGAKPVSTDLLVFDRERAGR